MLPVVLVQHLDWHASGPSPLPRQAITDWEILGLAEFVFIQYEYSYLSPSRGKVRLDYRKGYP